MGEVKAISKFIDPEQTTKDLAIDPSNLNKELLDYSGTFYYYSARSIEARHAYDMRKVAHSIMEKEVNTEYRTSLKEENPKTTEGQIDAAASVDPRIKAGAVRLLNAKREYELANAATEAYAARRDILLAIARGAAREQMGAMSVTGMDAAKERFLEAASKSA